MTKNNATKVDGVGRRIAVFRRLCGFSTAADLAAALRDTRITAATLANIESGRRADISVAQLIEISRTLQISPMMLLVDVFNPSDVPDIRGLSPDSSRLTNQDLLDWFSMQRIPFEERTLESEELENLEKAFKQLKARYVRSHELLEELEGLKANAILTTGFRQLVQDLEYELQVNLYALEGAWLKLKGHPLISLDWFSPRILERIDRDFSFERPNATDGGTNR